MKNNYQTTQEQESNMVFARKQRLLEPHKLTLKELRVAVKNFRRRFLRKQVTVFLTSQEKNNHRGYLEGTLIGLGGKQAFIRTHSGEKHIRMEVIYRLLANRGGIKAENCNTNNHRAQIFPETATYADLLLFLKQNEKSNVIAYFRESSGSFIAKLLRYLADSQTLVFESENKTQKTEFFYYMGDLRKIVAVGHSDSCGTSTSPAQLT